MIFPFRKNPLDRMVSLIGIFPQDAFWLVDLMKYLETPDRG
jgi:hypothetical protein